MNIRDQDRIRERKKRDRCSQYVDEISSPHLTLNRRQCLSCRAIRHSHPTVYVSRFLYRGVALTRSTWMHADLTELYASVTVVVTMGYRGESRVSIPPPPLSPLFSSACKLTFPWCARNQIISILHTLPIPIPYNVLYVALYTYTIYPVLYPSLSHYAVHHTPLSASLPSHRLRRTRTQNPARVIPTNFLTNCFFRRRSAE